MNAVELFVGAGGMALGGSKAGLKPRAVVDWDKWACETIRQNARAGIAPFSRWPLHECDVRQFRYDQIGSKIDVVTGGPPCQPFSLGGRHMSSSDSRDMFPEAVRAVRELQPKAFVFENVKGLTRTTFRNYFEYIRLQLKHPEIVQSQEEDWTDHLRRLEDFESANADRGLCYQVLTEVLNAADFGVPQRRERVFFVGIRSDLKAAWHFPKSTHSREQLAVEKWITGDYWERNGVDKKRQGAAPNKLPTRSKVRAGIKAWRTVREALADLPDPERDPERCKQILNHRFQPGARSYPGHTGSPLDEPAKTLKAGVHGVPGGENMLRRLDGTVRYFTVRESARLQTFPDEMALHGSWSEAMRQLGNAVPSDLAKTVIESVLKSIK
ncbi:DNA cytosine methyltransferase [Sphingorhabdus lacus]|uniref:DNA (cytosine-5-)-methyltransferase n=1 Tax=Sphingorhabdus lacus TaxID=392610 RepID=A0A6I6LEP5_9SPHN|nr:DNA cytosine methyltransferase [Sphingorhabdus lacus]QGY80803.1 DNA (cytosine-5-)-methyltransferase [Sphingorhabdus lacus]